MMTFSIVLLLVLAFMVGNIMWLRPSPFDRALIVQRKHAKTVGFDVHLRLAPEWLELPEGRRMVAHYQWPQALPKALIGKWRWHAGLSNWQPVNNAAAWLNDMPWPTPAPNGWLGIEVLTNATIVYWREDAKSTSIDTMRAVIAVASA
jgi:hypothetical protein